MYNLTTSLHLKAKVEMILNQLLMLCGPIELTLQHGQEKDTDHPKLFTSLMSRSISKLAVQKPEKNIIE